MVLATFGHVAKQAWLVFAHFDPKQLRCTRTRRVSNGRSCSTQHLGPDAGSTPIHRALRPDAVDAEVTGRPMPYDLGSFDAWAARKKSSARSPQPLSGDLRTAQKGREKEPSLVLVSLAVVNVGCELFGR